MLKNLGTQLEGNTHVSSFFVIAYASFKRLGICHLYKSLDRTDYLSVTNLPETP